MSQSTADTLPPQSPQDRLAQTAAGVSTSSLASPHPYILASRKPQSPAVLQGSLIPRDYLSSLSSSRSPSDQQRKIAEDNTLYEKTPTPNESGKRLVKNTTEGQAALTRDKCHNSTAPPNELESSVLSTSQSPKEQGVTALWESPKSYASSSASVHPLNNMPRTSSIDSAISNISNASHAQKQLGEVKELTREEVQNLIATAGSAENLIQHLLKDKGHAAAQNAQLWKLVDKQRALLLGLNKDLERLTKERDRYRKRVKELQAQPSMAQVDRLRMEEGNSPQSDGEASVASREPEPAASLDLGLRPVEQILSKGVTDSHMQSSPIDPAMMPSPLYLQQQPPKMQSLATHLAQPSFALTEPTPLTEKPPKSFQASRKAPPKPLDLRPTKEEVTAHQVIVPNEVIVSGDEDDEEREPMQRGRRKTREEDDRDRELLVLKEQEVRSRSKKEKKAKTETEDPTVLEQMPLSPPVTEVSQTLPLRQDHLSPASITSGSVGSSVQMSLPLRSPGLPMSPRPMMGSALPMSPRLASGNFPLSPRAPKMPLPMPTTPGQQAPNPQALAQVQIAASESHKKIGPSSLSKMNTAAGADSDRGQIHESPLSPGEVPLVNRGLVDPSWPDLLLPPNALPSIQVKVASSRLRPSRNSMLGLRMPEENAVFSLSIFERATASEFWRVEKIPTSLPILEQQLRSRCSDLPKLPDRKLFSGHSPAVVDARRNAINEYFDDLLDTPMDEQAAAVICRFLSTDVMEPQPTVPSHHNEDTQIRQVSQLHSGVPTKSGYLTKKGKNFGGWKSRYFVLDSPELRYFEAPGGAHLGTIKLLNARIGRQTQSDPPSEVDSENQYRHAFLILEPKRKDLNSHVRHVLCAESDAERDEWVETLLHYIDERPMEPKSQYGAGVQTSHTKDAKLSQRMGYEDAESKSNGSPQTHSDTPSPSIASSQTPELLQEPVATSKAYNISGPMNGAVISDAGSWGNKSASNSGSKEREQKKRNLFHFRKPSYEQLAPLQPVQPKKSELNARRGGHVRPVFGMQLQEAVEYYSPVDVEVYLPAVVYRCIEFLRVKNAANEEGLFRLSGSNIVIRLLKDRFNTEGDVDLLADEEDYDVHAVASLFKTYLRELPSTILTRELHLEFLKGLELPEKSQKIVTFNILVHQLPNANFSLLRTLSQYLLEVVQNSERNKMTIKNVGIVFSPTLNIPAPLFALFLTDFEAIFDKPTDQESIRSTEFERGEGALTPEDIRSPRRQMFTDLPTPMYNQDSFAHNARATGGSARPEYQLDPTSDLGFAPLQPSYECRQYVSIPHDMAMSAPRYPPPQPPNQHGGSNQYGGSNNMMAPENAASARARRRESSMLFM
ncbi:RalA-binding protein 1 [Cladophialophora psammophila CBS 110553]|uniref:RalA-binding protein 1 n=1 Tax=Cladophialophora psammophila CBS 110553 TaxID=1182543 RepID=W9VDN0_9EURO|nr:RalA-binding protein 1 [Cladophialophora psammophila CBS 110553]EXJ53722.1 RalA-binding protein 1 [Cladophialophora psammophila CBS 110553]